MYHNLPMYEHENIRIWECICIYSIYIYIYIHTCRTYIYIYIYIDMHAYNKYLHTYVESLCNHPQSKIKTIAVMSNGAVTGGSPWNLGRHVRDRKATGKRLARKAPSAVTTNCHQQLSPTQLTKLAFHIAHLYSLKKVAKEVSINWYLWTLPQSHQPCKSAWLWNHCFASIFFDDQNIYTSINCCKAVHSWLV